MQTKKIKTGLTFVAVILFSCNRQNNTENVLFESKSSKNPADIITKRWDYVCDNIFVNCFIQINPDSTFNYQSGGCMGTCYTSGKWIFNGNLLVLNSFDKYKPAIATVVETEEPKQETEEKAITSSDSSTLKTFTLSIIKPSLLTSSFIPCTTNQKWDSTTTFFKDRLFVLEQDTLYELTGNIGKRSGNRFYASKHNN